MSPTTDHWNEAITALRYPVETRQMVLTLEERKEILVGRVDADYTGNQLLVLCYRSLECSVVKQQALCCCNPHSCGNIYGCMSSYKGSHVAEGVHGGS